MNLRSFHLVNDLPNGRATAPSRFTTTLMVALILICFAPAVRSQTPRTNPKPNTPKLTSRKPASSKLQTKKAPGSTVTPNLAKEPTLYVVGYAHLDTEWRWEYPQVISEYLTKTMRNNFALFEKYPHYIFNFTGANRYRLMKEYYPSDFERLKHYVAGGRLFSPGCSLEESTANSP